MFFFYLRMQRSYKFVKKQIPTNWDFNWLMYPKIVI